jgi:small-conductance mechanosensitive channel
MRARFLKSLVTGAVIAAALVAFEASFRRAALAATAAKSGGHETVNSILMSGFMGTTLIATLVVFVLATLGTRRQARARRAAPQSWSTAAPRRRRADSWR